MKKPDSRPETASGPDRDRPVARVGLLLILLSGILWFGLFAIPFLPLAVEHRAALVGVDFVLVQIAWWTGAALAGPQTVAWLKTRFRRTKAKKP